MFTPKIIHQTWKNHDVPRKLQRYADSCKQQNDTYEYKLWTDDDLRALVVKEFPQYISAYDKFSHNIERVDFARYVMMYSIGGVYADLDIQCLRPFDSLVAMNKPVLGTEPREHRDELYQGRKYVICNALLISPPGESLWLRIMEYIVRHYRPGVNPVVNTGPMALTFLYEEDPSAYKGALITNPCIFYSQTDFKTKIKQHIRDEEIPAISRECSIMNAVAVHRWAHTWCGGNAADKSSDDGDEQQQTYNIVAMVLFFVLLTLTVVWLCMKKGNK